MMHKFLKCKSIIIHLWLNICLVDFFWLETDCFKYKSKNELQLLKMHNRWFLLYLPRYFKCLSYEIAFQIMWCGFQSLKGKHGGVHLFLVVFQGQHYFFYSQQVFFLSLPSLRINLENRQDKWNPIPLFIFIICKYLEAQTF